MRHDEATHRSLQKKSTNEKQTMKRTTYYLLLLWMVSHLACEDIYEEHCYQDEERTVCIETRDSVQRLLNIHKEDTAYWELKYPVYQFLYEDISNNGEKNILVGVIKPSRFDSVVRKRLFVFKFYEEEIRPLWLGARLGMPIENFYVETIDGKNYIKAIEQEKNGNYATALYEWDSFGFKFIKYLDRNLKNPPS